MLAADAAPPRLVSLDALRGLSVAGMVVVNNPGSWSAVYWPLAHAPWHGWTPTDLVFPFFLFTVGAALAFSRRVAPGAALRRAAIIFGLGFFMALYPRFDLATVRIPGVLQRIAVCYLAAFACRRWLGTRGQVAVVAALLLGYWLALTRIPVPGGLPPNLEPATNLGAWVDRALLGDHLWRVSRTWDPEGPFSTLPAIATTVLGLLAGTWMRSAGPGVRATGGLLAAGLLLFLLGLAWGTTFPINKSLWTSSYVLLTGGLAAYTLGLFHWIADVRGYRAWARPLVLLGRNAIVVFVGSGLLVKTLFLVRWAGPDGAMLSLHGHIHRTLFLSWSGGAAASLAHALAHLALWLGVAWSLDRRGLHVKV